MDQTLTFLPYESTGYFSKIVADYLSGADALKPFYLHKPDKEGIQVAIAAREKFDTPRALLADSLTTQYKGIHTSEKVNAHISLLRQQNSFTVTTAHQPNIFTGPLYFIYKILHAIALAKELKQQLPQYDFVPVYYMGSEDADLDELGYIHVGGQKMVWETKQTGAVGRMKVDKALIRLIHAVHGQTGVLPFGKELTTIFTECYTEGKTIQQATLELVNALFGEYGLLVLIPDNPALKKIFQPVVEKELLEGFSHTAVAGTIAALEKNYKVQAGGRELNLFYLLNDKRERIEREGERYFVRPLGLEFSKEEILDEVSRYPDRFSANVILRGAFQETILPNIAFIGGGGELAYWLELKNVFAAVHIPYPVLLLRNSFLIAKKEQLRQWEKTGFGLADLFRDTESLFTELVKKESGNRLSLADELAAAREYYAQLRTITDKVDTSLSEHVTALEKQAMKKLVALEKKLLRAEKKKYAVQKNHLDKIKSSLFPGNSLQERNENMALFYAAYGKKWIEGVLQASSAFNKGFGIVTLDV